MAKRRWLITGGVLAVVAVVVAVVAQPAPLSSRRRLEMVRDGLDSAGPRHFRARLVLTGTSPEGARLDADVSGEGHLTAGKAHSQWTEPGGLYEEVLMGDDLYSRWAGDQDALERARWRFGTVGQDQDTGRSLGARALFESGSGAPDFGLASPANLARLLGHVGLQAGTGRTVEGTVAFDELFPGGSADGRDGVVTVKLTASDSGALERMVWTVTGHVDQAGAGMLSGDFRFTADVAFTRPEGTVTLAAPADDLVDRPGEQARHEFAYDPSSVAREQGFPVLAPTVFPDGFRLVGASVTPADDKRCAKVALHWEDPARWGAWLASDHLSPSPSDMGLREYSAACLGEIATPGAPFQAGAYQGTVSLPFEEYDFATIYLTVGDTHMVIKSDLPLETLRAAVASIKPWDLDAQPLLPN